MINERWTTDGRTDDDNHCIADPYSGPATTNSEFYFTSWWCLICPPVNKL